MAGFPNSNKAAKVQDALYDIRFRNVDYLLEKIAKMDKEIGTLEEFEDTIPDILYLRTLASKDDLKRFYKKNFKPISCRYDKNNPDVLTFYLKDFFSIDTYIKWLSISESLTLTDYSELYISDNASLNIEFTLRLDNDSKTINENTTILNDFIELFNDFKDSIDD